MACSCYGASLAGELVIRLIIPMFVVASCHKRFDNVEMKMYHWCYMCTKTCTCQGTREI